jgi:hypothetical protein
MALEVDTVSLRETASRLSDAGSAIGGDAGGAIDALGGAADPNVQAGLEAIAAAWGAALNVLGEDVGFLSQQTAVAAEIYDTTDQELGGGPR